MVSLFRLRVVVDVMQEASAARSPRQFLEGERDNPPCLRFFEIDDARNDTSRVEAPDEEALAAEYRDVQAAAAYLRSQPRVDASRIGIYGGSYGGYLTALALARNSDLFAAGVDIHGVHDWTTERARGMLERQRYEQAPDVAAALDTAWRSSPVSSVGTWRSPVLLIHGDDDRNVRFAQSTDLARRLAAAKVPFETLVIPDDTHHFLRYANIVTVDKAAAAFLERQLLQAHAEATRATGP